MIRSLYDSLMRRVYHPITAIVSISKCGIVLDVVLLDSLFASLEDIRTVKDADTVVIFGHPDGCTQLCCEERNTLSALMQFDRDMSIRAYICGEDIGCLRVDTASYCAIIGNNTV